MANPIPLTTDGSGPEGAIPVALYGVGGGGGGASTTDAITIEGTSDDVLDGLPLNNFITLMAETLFVGMNDLLARVQALEEAIDLDND